VLQTLFKLLLTLLHSVTLARQLTQTFQQTAIFSSDGMWCVRSTLVRDIVFYFGRGRSMPPDATSIAQTRVMDTLIGAAISLLTISIIISRHRSLSTTASITIDIGVHTIILCCFQIECTI
jgi:hypothetical protein